MRRLLAALACAALAWSLIVWLAGGLDVRAAGHRLTSNDPIRPAVAGVLVAVCYLAVARRRGVREDAAAAARWLTPARVAVVIAAASTCAALAFTPKPQVDPTPTGT